jgi:hypothetical protein
MLHHEVDSVAMTDAELEDFLSFMDHGPNGAPGAGALHSGPLGALAAPDAGLAMGALGTGCMGAFNGIGGAAGHAAGPHGVCVGAPTSSSEAPGSSDQHDSHMAVTADRECQRSPGSSEDCSGGPGSRATPGVPLGVLPEGAAFPAAHAPMAVPMPVARAASAAELGGGGGGGGSHPGRHHPEIMRAHSVASLGSLTMPLEGLALGSPALLGPLAGTDGGGSGHGMVMFGGHQSAGMSPAFRGAFRAPPGVPLVMSMGAFGHAGPASAGAAFAGSAPPGGAVTLASTLDAGGEPGGGLSTSWPSAGAAPLSASVGSAGAAAPRSRSGGVSKPPSSGGRGGRARGGSAAAAAAAGDATYHRSSGGGGTLSHSTIEKQRRDRLNGLLDELGTMVPPSDGRSDGSRRPKHVILSDAIALLGSLQEQLRLGVDEISSLKTRLAAAEAGGRGGASSGSVVAGGGIDIAARAGSGTASAAGGCGLARPEPSSSAETAACLLPPTPVCTSPADALPGMLRCASSDADLSLPAPAGGGTPGAPASVTVEQEGGCLRVAVSCHDREGLLGDLVAALKGTGARIAKASITTTGDGAARDDFELRLEGGGDTLRVEDVRGAVMAALGGGGAGAAAAARSKRTRQ